MADRREYEVDGKSLSQLRVVDLKQELEKRGLPKSGSKKELVDRLKVQLQLEKLQENASTDEGHVPNLKLQDDAIAEQNDVIKEYLAKQQQIYEVQKEVRRRVELEELKAQESSEAEASPGDTSQEDDETAAHAADKEEASSSSRRNTRQSRIPARAKVVFDDEDDGQSKVKGKEKEEEEEKETSEGKDEEKEKDAAVTVEEMEISRATNEEPIAEKDKPVAEKEESNEEQDKDAVGKDKEVVGEKDEEPEPCRVELEDENKRKSSTGAGKNSAKPDAEKKDDVPEGSPLPCDLTVTRASSSLSSDKPSDAAIEEDRKSDKPSASDEEKGKSGEVLGGLKAPDVFTQESDTSCEPLELTSDAAKSRHSQPSAENKTDDDFSAPEGGAERGDDDQHGSTEREEKMDVAEDETSQEPMNLVSKGEDAPALDDKDQPVVDEGPKGSTQESLDVTEEPRDVAEEARDLTCTTGESLTRSRSPSPNHDRSRSRSASRSRSRSPSRSGSPSSRSSSKSKSRSRSRSKSKSRSPSSDVASRSPSPSGRRLPVTKREPTPVDHEAMDTENSPSQPANYNCDGKVSEPMEVAPSPDGVAKTTHEEDNGISENEPKIPSRRISLSSNKENGEKPARKRRWGSTSIAKTSLSISTDSLKGLIPDVKTPKESPLAEVSGPELAVELEEDLALDPPVAKKDLKIVRTVTQVVLPPKIPEKVEAPAEIKEPVVTRRIVLGRQVSRQVTEEVDVGKRAPSPARNPSSRIVHIRNLVRPFTLNQLKEMLGSTGVLVNDGFWIDKIKSKCYVTYSSVEEAVATRLALHGTKWPSSNPKNLMVDFAEQDELDFHKNLTEVAEGIRPMIAVAPAPVQPLLPPTQKPLAPPNVKARNKSKEKEKEREKEKGAVTHQTREPQSRKDQKSPKHKENVRDARDIRIKDGRVRDRDRRAAPVPPPPPIREWDRDKIGERSPGERDRARMQAARERRRSPNAGGPASGGDAGRRADREKRRGKDRGHKEEEAPAKLLDDLFRKTKATPCIYWLPLTVDQIKQKEEERRLRQMEREKRKLLIAKEERDKEEAVRKEREKERDDIHRNRAHVPRKH